MGTPFQDACAAASDAIDTVYGEPFVYLPMTAADPNARRTPDPNRATTPIVGFFFDPYARAASGPARRQGVKVEHPGHGSSRPVLDIALAQLPFAPRRGDRVQRLEDNSLWELAEPRPDGTGRAEIDLNHLSGPPGSAAPPLGSS
jgi:hypothetical protein